MSTLYQQIYLVVQQIPAGRVSTYGQIAAIVGPPCTAREVGYAMAALKPEDPTPWQRVINAKGQISQRGGMGPMMQRDLLEQEYVIFDDKDTIDLNEFGWRGPAWEWLEANNFNPAPPLLGKKNSTQPPLF